MKNNRNRGFTLIEATLLLALIGVIILVGVYGYGRYHKSAATNNSSLSFSVSKTSITYNGNDYIPYGVTIFSLSESTWQSNEASDIAQIHAIAGFWHGNTVRIQVAPSLYNSPPSGYIAAFNKEILTARSDGLNVIISAQYERTNKIAGPDSSTVSFWKSAAPSFANDSHVWFDLFNEPRYTCDGNTIPTADCWKVWLNGDNSFVGMQSLVNDVRAGAPNNLILVEGLAGGKSLDGIYNYLPSGSNLVYSVHPYFGKLNTSAAQWDSNFGTISSQIPVLVGEWGEYQTVRGSCVTNAPTLVPNFLSYLTSRHIGLIAWTLQSGIMIRGTNLEDPTAFDPGVTYQCITTNTKSSAQGAGADIRSLFMAH